MKNKIILNHIEWNLNGPAYKYSLAENILNDNGYETVVCYWKFRLEELQLAFWGNTKDVIDLNIRYSMLFLNYLAIKGKSTYAFNLVKTYLLTHNPQYFECEDRLIRQHMLICAEKTAAIIEKMMLEMLYPNVLLCYFTIDYTKWLIAAILADNFKRFDKNCTIVVDCPNDKNFLNKCLTRFKQFDCTIIYKDIETHNTNNFILPKNFIIENKPIALSQLIDELIIINKNNTLFPVSEIDLNTKETDISIIKKIVLAGIDNVSINIQIFSNDHISSTYGCNLLFIKYANIYRIGISGIKLLLSHSLPTNYIENTIYNFIHNMSLLRFYHNVNFNLLSIEIQTGIENEGLFTYNFEIDSVLTNNVFKSDTINKINNAWDKCMQVGKYLSERSYEYKLLKINEKILYREYSKNELVKEIEFEENSVDWIILKRANKEIVSLSQINIFLKDVEKELHIQILDIEIFNAIQELADEKLLYVSRDFHEIVAVIDTEYILVQ